MSATHSNSLLGRTVDMLLVLLFGASLIYSVSLFMPRLESHKSDAPVRSAQIIVTPTVQHPDRAQSAESATSILSFGPKEVVGNPVLFHSFPIIRERFIETKRASDFVLYSPFFRTHKLTPVQIGQIMDILSNRETSWVDLQVKRGGGETGYDAKIEQQMNREANLARDSSLLNVMGPSTFDQFKEYRASLAARTHPVGLRAIIAISYDGAHPVQASQFESLMKASQETGVFGRRPDPSGPADYTAMESKMRKIAMPEQIEDIYLILDYRKLENASNAAANSSK